MRRVLYGILLLGQEKSGVGGGLLKGKDQQKPRNATKKATRRVRCTKKMRFLPVGDAVSWSCSVRLNECWRAYS
jgi:hypothetical protein